MQQEYGVTVVVPAYNAEATIQKGIESVLQQSYKGLQLIIIDDGSTDKTVQMIEPYTKCDNVILHRQKNQGVSCARNKGLELAEGKYIFFLDADDYLDENTIEVMHLFARQNDLDLVSCNHIEENATIYKGNTNAAKAFVAETDAEIGTHFFEVFPKSVWAKLFRRDILTTYQIRFPEKMNLGEDWYFSFTFLKHAQRIGKVDNVSYHVENVNPESLSKRYVANLEADIVKQYALWEELIQMYPQIEQEYYKDHMDYKAYLVSLYANNFYKNGSTISGMRAYRQIKIFLKKHTELFPNRREKQKAPKNKVEKVTYYAIQTKSGMILGMLFGLKEFVKRRKLKN